MIIRCVFFFLLKLKEDLTVSSTDNQLHSNAIPIQKQTTKDTGK